MIKDVKPIHCSEVFEVSWRNGMKKNTMQCVREVMHGFFESAVENSFITFNPVTKSVKIPVEEEPKIRFLTVQEQKDFLERSKNTANYNFFAFALQTGMRVSEILALTWDDVDLKKIKMRKQNIISGHRQKNKSRNTKIENKYTGCSADRRSKEVACCTKRKKCKIKSN